MTMQQLMASLTVGQPQVFGGLAVFPLLGATGVKRKYLTLSEAFDRRGIEVSEVSEGGSVPELRLKNLLDVDVFAADGETLLGAKQNRVLNASIYVKAKSEVVIPVSCVEQGRWGYRQHQRSFGKSEHSEFLDSRATKMASVHRNLKSPRATRYSDQSAVWDAVDAKQMSFGADAPTRSMEDVYNAGQESLDRYIDKIRPQPDQVGMACAIDGDTVSVELFEVPDVFGQFFDKLLRACAAEVAFRHKVATLVPDASALGDLLNSIARCAWEAFPAVGHGRELRMRMGRLNGAALEVDERFVHIAVLRDQGRARR